MSLTNIDEKLAGIPLAPEPVNLEDTSTKLEVEPPNLPTRAEPVEAVEKVAEEPTQSESEAKETDDYGTPVSKKEKVYTEAEVQEMIRRRVKEKHEPAQPIQQQQSQPANEGDGESWEAQLESFVEQTLSKREQKLQEQSWQQAQQHRQAEFEIKFNSGAAKYDDFESVVMGKPLTPQMVTATMGMDNPAAFIYAAAKSQAGELDRISKIPDPLIQAVELGKLEERMKKAKAHVSSAPRPIDMVKGDVGDRVQKRNSVDDILRAEMRAKKKFAR